MCRPTVSVGPSSEFGPVGSRESSLFGWATRNVPAAGWLLVLTMTFFIDHFDLFGVRQVWLNLVGRPYTHLPFATPMPYRIVRHPLYLGFLLAFWATPTMTWAHLFFAVATTSYILLAIQFEERDLSREYGTAYLEYRRRVSMLLPLGRPSAHAGEAVVR